MSLIVTSPHDPAVEKAMQNLVTREPRIAEDPEALRNYRKLFMRVVHNDKRRMVAEMERNDAIRETRTAWLYVLGSMAFAGFCLYRLYKTVNG